MKIQVFISTLALAMLVVPGLGHTHGVERGSIMKLLMAANLNSQVATHISREIVNRCSLESVVQLDQKSTVIESVPVDQDVSDVTYTIELTAKVVPATVPAMSNETVEPVDTKIVVKVTEYSISSPYVDNIEINYLDSKICK